MPPQPFTSVIPAMITPFTDDLQVAAERLAANARSLQAAGIAHVVVCGTMGEAGALSDDERRVVVETVLATGLTVSVGVSSADAPTAARHARAAAALGAAGVMCLPPTAYRADDRELDAHFAAVAGATALPLMLYNNPEAARQDLPAATIARLVEAHDSIVAVKECSGDARRIAQLAELLGERAAILVGGDDWALEGYAAGARGWVSGVANVAPEQCLELEACALAGDLAAARALHLRLLPLGRLDMTPKLVQYFKAALDETGGHGGPVRPPRLALTAPEQATARAAVAALGTGHAAEQALQA
jgi:dihydrodipicolinate synthase/N-acetylneuraminate lyase